MKKTRKKTVACTCAVCDDCCRRIQRVPRATYDLLSEHCCRVLLDFAAGLGLDDGELLVFARRLFAVGSDETVQQAYSAAYDKAIELRNRRMIAAQVQLSGDAWDEMR